MVSAKNKRVTRFAFTVSSLGIVSVRKNFRFCKWPTVRFSATNCRHKRRVRLRSIASCAPSSAQHGLFSAAYNTDTDRLNRLFSNLRGESVGDSVKFTKKRFPRRSRKQFLKNSLNTLDYFPREKKPFAARRLFGSRIDRITFVKHMYTHARAYLHGDRNVRRFARLIFELITA